MDPLVVAAAQFAHQDGQKAANLETIARLAAEARRREARIVCFHECCITGYTFLQHLNEDQLLDLAEPVPDGPSIRELWAIAIDYDLILMAGLLERTPRGTVRNSYVVVGPDGLRAQYSKLHPFIHPALEPGDGHVVVDLLGIRFGLSICYDNNLPENVRANALRGAQVVVMPHVTGCTPSPMPGRGEVDPALWEARRTDPARLRREFQGPKGREWLMRWLPARAWENGVFVIFTNPIGLDGGTIKPGLSMILDPNGEVMAECTQLDEDLVVASLTGQAYQAASGRRYLRARRPELYGDLVKPRGAGDDPVTEPGWRLAHRDPTPDNGP